MKANENRNQRNYRLTIVFLGVAIFMLFLILFMIVSIYKANKNQISTELSYDNLTTVKQVVEYYESTYISEEDSKEKGYNIDIYLKFAKLPYTDDDTSNEKYYNDFIEDIAKVIRYKNFTMVDKENDITIKVTCKKGKVDKILINDIEDYFIYMDSQISMKTYEEIEITKFDISSEILKRIVDENWNNLDYFGQRESIYDEYYIYTSQGIKARIIQNKVYNVIFDKNYKENVINNLFAGIDFSSVKSSLGEPTFEDKENEVIGYKGEKIYVFFSKDELSVYRVIDSDTDDFFKLADEFINSKIDLLEFMNQLTYMWPDYAKYEYTESTVYLSYPLKGIEIKLNYDDTDGILVYNNIRSSLSKIGRYLENTNFVARLKQDSVFEAECKRINKKNTEKQRADEYQQNLDENEKNIIGESLEYYYYPEKDSNGNIYSMKFISKNENRPNRELNDNINSYLWISNSTFIYSKSKKGIYSYDLREGRVTRILEGNDEFKFKEYKDGILYYDKKEIML